MSSLPPIYFGPKTAQPSWTWVGADIAEFLRASMEIRYFERLDQIADGALVFWIKCPPNALTTEEVVKKALRIVFFPVDAFLNRSAILANSQFIKHASLICLHARSLAPFFPSARVEFVDHYNKYGVQPSDRQPDNTTLLWIGGFQYVPYVLGALDKINWPHERIRLLTNQNHGPARTAAERNALAMGLGNYWRTLASRNIQISHWSERAQREALTTCAAAFDIKHLNCFNQLHKPPTKLQKYLVSGIPCAVNKDFPAARQVENVVEIEQLEFHSLQLHFGSRLSSYREYLSKSLSIETVAKQYVMFAIKALDLRSSQQDAFLEKF